MARFKLVGGKTHMLPFLYGDRAFVRGDVTDEIADERVCEMLRSAKYMDALNNTHYYWQEVDEDGETVEAESKPARGRRIRKAVEEVAE